MVTARQAALPTVALIGNPNTGKSTLFNALAGVRQRVGNYPGVTVEKKLGQMTHAGRRYQLVDLPGTYSLAPRSPDEMVAVDVLLGRRADVPRVDAVICIVDASNLERNLYLVSQVLALGRPTVLALNMMDVARERGIAIDLARLSERLGVPVVPIEAHRRRGIEQLQQALAQVEGRAGRAPARVFPEPFDREVERLAAALKAAQVGPGSCGAAAEERREAAMPRYLVERLLLDTSGYLAETLHANGQSGLAEEIRAARTRLAEAGWPVPAVEAMARYRWVGEVLAGVVTRPAEQKPHLTDRIDRVVTHRVWGMLLFAALMSIMFQSVFVWAVPFMDWIDEGMNRVAGLVDAALAPGALESLLVQGVIGGFGSVLVFLPQIFILFFFMAILEDCGYMARAAYLMDKLMVRVGLSGKSFIPLLSSFACAVPGIMATRVIENRRDRLTTILVAPLMSCSARLPVYTVLIAAFIPQRSYLGGLVQLQGMTLATMYLVGIVTAVAVACVLKRTVLRGPTPAFVMELPVYKMPSPRTVLHRMLDRGWAFVRRAGTLIVAVSIVVWAALYYPHPVAEIEGPFAPRRAALVARIAAAPEASPQRRESRRQLAQLDNLIAGAYQRQSILGRLGQFLEPAVRPLGWDWRIGCAAIASFPAREVVVATLGVIYNLGSGLDIDDEGGSTRLQTALREARWDARGTRVYNIPVALSIMVFFALCAQCAATLAVIRRETNSWRWPAFTFIYMTVLAYLGALLTYQVGMHIGG